MDCQLSRPRAGGFWDRENLICKPTIEARPPLACKAAFAGDGGLSLPEGRKKIAFATEKFPNCNRVRTSTNPKMCRRFGRGTPKQQRRFGRGTPKQQQRRPTRVRFCRLGPLDRTRLRCRTTVPQLVSRPDQRPPSGQRQFRTRTRPPEHGHRITDTRTAPCLNARGCWIYQGRGPAQEVPLPQRHPAEWSIAPEGVHLANRCACSESLGRTRLATLLQV